jgi:hypothetical protein
VLGPAAFPSRHLSHLQFIHYNSKMFPVRELGRTLLILAAFLAAIGAFLHFSPRLPFKPGKLPGDIVRRTEHTTIYFPVLTCLILSAALSLIFWLINHFRR